MASSVTIMPYMMGPGEDRIVADAIFAALTKPGHYDNPVIPTGAPAEVQGTWAVVIQYARGVGEQRFTLKQSGSDLSGTQVGEIYKASLKGSIHADKIELVSDMAVSGNAVAWNFQGDVTGTHMGGIVQLGEFGTATWKATRT